MWKLKIGKVAALVVLLMVNRSAATEYQPWLGNFYEFELRSSFLYQEYSKISCGGHHRKYPSHDVFLNMSLSHFRPDPAIGLEIELIEARTERQKGDIDQVKFTGRYVWQDDVAGDPLSVTTGLSYMQAFYYSLRDVSSFHHGYSNAELFLSVGRENPDESLWGSRWWAVFALGVAERGSPWLRFHLDYEKRFQEKHAMQTFLHSLWGLGGQRLHLNHFHGYGPIQHQSIDLGLRYTYFLEFYGSASVEYSYRIYARNFPSYTHQVLAQILYTFGL